MKGILIPIGGNEDKGNADNEIYTLDFVGEGILFHVVKESGGLDAKIIVIPTASSIPVEVGENYLDAFGKLACTNVQVMDIRERAEAEDEKNLALIRSADCVMFSGGDQSRITEVIGGSTMHQILTDRYENDGLVIAGTSAGAMSMSMEMITGGSGTEALLKGSVRMDKGMEFISELIIDSHFIQRGRFGRLAEAVAKFPNLLGIGLAEDTGLVIKDGNNCKVIGSGMVTIFDPSKLAHNNVQILEEGTPMSLSNLVVHVLANTDRFVLADRSIHILPIDAPFE